MIGKIVQFLLVGSLTTVVAACYGVIMDFQERFFNRRVKTVDEDGTPVPELTVNLVDPGRMGSLAEERTDSDGVAELGYFFRDDLSLDELRVWIEDTDGTENGGLFESYDGPLFEIDDTDTTSTDERVVTLERATIPIEIAVDAVDESGEAVPGLFVQLVEADTGGVLAEGTTDENGSVTLASGVVAGESPGVSVATDGTTAGSVLTPSFLPREVSIAAWPPEGEAFGRVSLSLAATSVAP